MNFLKNKKIAILFLMLFTFLNAGLIQEQRQANVNLYVESNQKLFGEIIKYIERTGDITPTRAEIQEFSNINNSEFTTFSQEQCSSGGGGFCGSSGGITISATKDEITLYNVFKSTSAEIQNYYEKSPYLNSNTYINASYTEVEQNMSIFGKAIWRLIEDVNADSTKIWYKNYSSLPSVGSSSRAYYVGNGVSGVDLYIYTPGVGYKKILTIDEENISASNVLVTFYKDDRFNPDTTVGFQNWKATVQSDDGSNFKEYLHDGTKWVSFSTDSEGGTSNHFEGDTTIVEMSTSIFDSEGGSVGVASAPNGEYSGTVEFTKKDNTSTGGYWSDNAGLHLVTQNFAQLKSQSWSLNAKAFYVDETDSKLYYLRRLSVPGIGTRWVYIADGYDDVATGFENISNTDGGYVYDAKNSKYFVKISSTVWRSTDNLIQLTASSSGRSAFTSWSSSAVYYTTINDCTSSTCNGTGGAFAGQTTDSMYGFIYTHRVSSRVKYKNYLVDAKRKTTFSNIYDDGDIASVYNTYLYVKRTDTLGRTIFYNPYNGYYYTRIANTIPTVLAPRYGNSANLPPNYDATTITFSGNYVIMANRTYATNWTTAPHGVGVRIGSTNYAHIKSGSQDFWTNNGSGDGQASASEIFTRGSRSMFPTVTHSINAMTKIVGTESRYTSSGITSTTDASFKVWYYATAGTRTKNLLDALEIQGNPYDRSESSTETAQNMGIGFKNGILGKWFPTATYNSSTGEAGGIWKTVDGTKWLNTSFAQYSNISNAVGVGINGLLYSACSGRTVLSTATSGCSAKSMSLPTKTQVRAWSTTGIPSCSYKTQTRTYSHKNSGYTARYFAWTNSSGTTFSSGGNKGDTAMYRCVR